MIDFFHENFLPVSPFPFYWKKIPCFHLNVFRIHPSPTEVKVRLAELATFAADFVGSAAFQDVPFELMPGAVSRWHRVDIGVGGVTFVGLVDSKWQYIYIYEKVKVSMKSWVFCIVSLCVCIYLYLGICLYDSFFVISYGIWLQKCVLILNI